MFSTTSILKSRRRLALVASATILAAGASIVGTDLPAVAEDTDAAGRAAAAAAALVASRPASLHLAEVDELTQLPVIASQGWYYVPYARTHRRLPVIGGDFVVVVDPAFRVSTTSVAQQYTLDGIDPTPALSQADAEHVAQAELTTATGIEGSRLVVYALGARPRLAWESTVTGKRDGQPSRLAVDVDAATGDVLGSLETVRSDTGTGAYNGPSPLPIEASPVHVGGYHFRVLRDPVTNRLQCGDSYSHGVFSREETTWGNGQLSDLETQCVDAMYAAQTQVRMLNHWLGRNGMNGVGGAWPMYVGLDEDNAFFNWTELQFGHDQYGHPYTSLDVVGHEFGHGIDDTTPGGLSRKGTAEFVADVFGTATEWYANEPAGFDPPDYTLGEKVKDNLWAIRYMYRPSSRWQHPDCYSTAVDTMEEHQAAGVGNHWFYLLAEGSNPGNGQPESPTCNHAVVSGVGITKATQLLYHAMLMKTSNSSYQAYRVWTLTAARTVFADNCQTYRKVKYAWDAVAVPAQPGEPQCIPDYGTNPGPIGGGNGNATVGPTVP